MVSLGVYRSKHKNNNKSKAIWFYFALKCLNW
jgi:hypothetical protein